MNTRTEYRGTIVLIASRCRRPQVVTVYVRFELKVPGETVRMWDVPGTVRLGGPYPTVIRATARAR